MVTNLMRRVLRWVLRYDQREESTMGLLSVAYTGILFGWGGQQIQLRTEDRENGDLGAVAPLVRGSGGSCNLVQEISFPIVKFS
jgi:hypothetical protein